ncbi:MAG: phosphatase PAP2 family protein [Clostridium sp.]|uniref:phosphatase PAP2 family protein n=1 Tax=Clostridium sp. TaxID=1506 RepID=UPI003D6CCF97
MDINIKSLLHRRNYVKDFLYLALMLTLPILDITYKMLNNPSVKVHSLMTDIDRSIPFVNAFIVPYVIWYGFIYAVLVYLYFKDKEIYLKTLLTYEVCILISFIIYALFQTTVPRPVLSGNDFLTNIVRWVYQSDNPFNCFPSTHSFSSYVIFKGVSESKIKNKIIRFVISSMCILVMISTIFVKQHVILDLLGAIILGEVVCKIVFKFKWEKINDMSEGKASTSISDSHIL